MGHDPFFVSQSSDSKNIHTAILGRNFYVFIYLIDNFFFLKCQKGRIPTSFVSDKFFREFGSKR